MAKIKQRFYWHQTGERCFQVYDQDAQNLSRAKGSRQDCKITAYRTRARADFCVQRLRSGRQKSPYDHRIRRKRAWPTAASL